MSNNNGGVVGMGAGVAERRGVVPAANDEQAPAVVRAPGAVRRRAHSISRVQGNEAQAFSRILLDRQHHDAHAQLSAQQPQPPQLLNEEEQPPVADTSDDDFGITNCANQFFQFLLLIAFLIAMLYCMEKPAFKLFVVRILDVALGKLR